MTPEIEPWLTFHAARLAIVWPMLRASLGPQQPFGASDELHGETLDFDVFRTSATSNEFGGVWWRGGADTPTGELEFRVSDDDGTVRVTYRCTADGQTVASGGASSAAAPSLPQGMTILYRDPYFEHVDAVPGP